MALLYGEVTFQGLLVSADRDDYDSNPDELPLRGVVEFVPGITHSYDTASGVMRFFDVLVAGLDENGVLRDGQGNDAMTLPSPLSPDLEKRDWVWTARFRLKDGAQLDDQEFALAPGQRKNIANTALLMDTTSLPVFAELLTPETMRIEGSTVFDSGTGQFSASGPIISTALDGTYTINT